VKISDIARGETERIAKAIVALILVFIDLR
jgi:hypothetical protein